MLKAKSCWYRAAQAASCFQKFHSAFLTLRRPGICSSELRRSPLTSHLFLQTHFWTDFILECRRRAFLCMTLCAPSKFANLTESLSRCCCWAPNQPLWTFWFIKTQPFVRCFLAEPWFIWPAAFNHCRAVRVCIVETIWCITPRRNF